MVLYSGEVWDMCGCVTDEAGGRQAWEAHQSERGLQRGRGPYVDEPVTHRAWGRWPRAGCDARPRFASHFLCVTMLVHNGVRL